MRLEWGAIPSAVIDHAKLRILDVAGVLLAASPGIEARNAFRAARELYGAGMYPVIGFEERCGLAGAAFVNGAMSAILEFDDTHVESAVHPTAPVLAVTAPFAVNAGLSGQALLRAVIIGSELLCRIGRIKPRFHSVLFHPTGLLGVFGAVYALASLQRIDADTTTHAVGLAGSMAAGLMTSWDDGSDAKSLQPGLAAAAGVCAVAFARNRLSGPSRVFESDWGFFRAHVQNDREQLRFEALNERLGEHWESLDIASKAYPSAYTIHPYVDAILALRTEHGVTADDVAEIVCGMPAYAMKSVCEPRADKLRPRTSWHARISVPHMVAEALVTGVMDKSSMTPAHLRDPRINALADRVTCVNDPRFDDMRRSGGSMQVRLRDGRTLSHMVENMRGTRANPIRQADYVAKFMRNAEGVLALQAAEQVANDMLTLERAADVSRVFAPLHSAGALR